MNRRDFISSAGTTAAALAFGGAAALAGAVPAPAIVARRRRDLVLASPFPQSASGPSDWAFRLARRLERALDDRVRVHLSTVPGSSIEVLGTGAADLVFAPESANFIHEPALAFMAGLPSAFALPARVQHSWLASREGQALWDECHERFGTKPLLAGNDGPRPGLFARRPLGSFTGLKVAAEGLPAAVLRGLGAEPRAVPPGERRAALARGEIDAADAGSYDSASAVGLISSAAVCIGGVLPPAGDVFALTMRQQTWQAFSGSEQHALRNAANENAREMLETAEANANAMRHVLAQAGGLCYIFIDSGLATAAGRVELALMAEIATRTNLCRRVSGAHMAASSVCGKSDCAPGTTLNAV